MTFLSPGFSAVSDLAPNSGMQVGAPPVIASHNLGGPIEDKAAFNNPPYAYGIVERTFSEYKSSPLSSTLVSDFNTLPADLKTDPGTDDFNGSLETTYKAAITAGTGGNYADGTDRYFSCQSCHMRPVGGDGFPGCNKNGAPVRKDLPRHDHTLDPSSVKDPTHKKARPAARDIFILILYDSAC